MAGRKKLCNSNAGFEGKLVLCTSIIVAIGSFIVLIVNTFLDLNKSLNYVLGSAVISYVCLYLLGKLYTKFTFIRWLIPFFSLIYVNLFWYFNYVSNGPTLIIFILFYSFVILVGNNRQILVFSLILLVNLMVLLLIELNYHNVLPNYTDVQSKVVNVYVVTYIALIITFIFLNYAKNNYVKQFLKAKEADELKSSFLANMSHEIRTPLNAIVGFSSLLAQRELNDKKKEKYKSFIESNSKYLLHLVNDILDISKIESNQLNLVINEFQVTKLCEQFKEEYANILKKQKKKDVEISYHLPEEDLIIKTDKFRLEQILRNFLTNAVKFTEKGIIKFGCYKKDKNVVFYVEDTGEGISEENLKLIFSRFTKLNNDGEDIHQGAGLGLYLSRQLASLMGGKIWAESVKGEGSIFHLSLPA